MRHLEDHPRMKQVVYKQGQWVPNSWGVWASKHGLLMKNSWWIRGFSCWTFFPRRLWHIGSCSSSSKITFLQISVKAACDFCWYYIKFACMPTPNVAQLWEFHHSILTFLPGSPDPSGFREPELPGIGAKTNKNAELGLHIKVRLYIHNPWDRSTTILTMCC